MDKKKIAKLFVESFRTSISTIVTQSSPVSERDDTCIGLTDNRGEIVFFNHADYEKRQFTADFKSFVEKLAKEYGVKPETIYRKESSGCKTFYYKFDPEQIVDVDGVKFRMGRRMMNMPHAVLDGVSHRYYVGIYDLELVNEIIALDTEHKLKLAKEKEARFPEKRENAIKQCREMIEKLTAICNGEIELTRELDLDRINSARFELCMILNG